jgi:hypothetical protein
MRLCSVIGSSAFAAAMLAVAGSGPQDLQAGTVGSARDQHSHWGGREVYFLSGDGLPMPARKDQPPPGLRYFRT